MPFDPKDILNPPFFLRHGYVNDFQAPHAQANNQLRLEHLHSLGLDLENKRVLEVGAGIGELSPFFLERHCELSAIEIRPENIGRLQQRFPQVTTYQIDLDLLPKHFDETYEVVFAYDILSYLQVPEKTIQWLASRTEELLLIETQVSPARTESIHFNNAENSHRHLSFHGKENKPTRLWLLNQLKKHFPYVYFTKTQPRWLHFPTVWEKSDKPCRCVIIASRTPLDNELLTQTIPKTQTSPLPRIIENPRETKISLLYTSARPQIILKQVELWYETAHDKQFIEIIVTGEFQQPELLESFARINAEKGYQIRYIHNYGPRCCTTGWNLAAENATGEILCIIADDFIPFEYWDIQLKQRADINLPEAITITDNGRGCTQFLTHPFSTRKFINQFGYLFHPSYIAYYVDLEYTVVAEMKNQITTDAVDMRFKHVPYFDEVLKNHCNQFNNTLGMQTYIQRERHDFKRWVYLKRDRNKIPQEAPDLRRHYITSYLNTCNCFTQSYRLFCERLSPEYNFPPDTDKQLSVVAMNTPEKPTFQAQQVLEFKRQGSGQRFELRLKDPTSNENTSPWKQLTQRIQEAQGEFICLLEAGDWVSFDFANSLLQVIALNPATDLIVFDQLETDENLKEILNVSGTEYEEGYEESSEMSVQYQPPTLNMCWRRSVLLDILSTDPDLQNPAQWAQRVKERVQDQVRINKVLTYRNTFRDYAFLEHNRRVIASYQEYNRFFELMRK